MLELERAQVGERRLERELLAVAAVDPGHERLDERVVGLAARAGASRTTRSTRRLRAAAGGRSTSAARRSRPSAREQRAVGQRVEIGRDHAGETLGERMELRAATDVAARVLRACARPARCRARAPRRARRRVPSARGSCPRAPSMTKPSTCSVSSFPPSRSVRSTRVISASGTSDSSSRAAASPAIPPPTTTTFTRCDLARAPRAPR